MNEKKNIKLTVFIIKLALILLIIGVGLGNFFLFSHYYEQFINYIIEHYQLAGKEEKIKALVNKQSYFLLKMVALLLLTFLLVLAARINYKKIAVGVINNLDELKKSIGNAYKHFLRLSTIEKIVLLSILFFFTALQLYYLFKLPFTIDEAFSYVYFVSKGFFVSASYYPGPNNHVLYSEVAVFFNCFIHNPVVSMRLPSLISSVLTAVLLFAYLQKKFGHIAAGIGAVFFCFSSATLFYSILGRGYALMSFFVLVSLISLQQALAGKKVYWYIFLLASVFGFYTIPVFLYPFSSFAAYALLVTIKDKKLLSQLFIYTALTVFFVALLYLPILLLNGFNAITGNPWVGAREDFFTRLPAYLASVCGYLWDAEQYGWIIAVCLLLLFLFFSFLAKKSENIIFISCAYVVPFVILIIQQALPFERVWTYFLIIQSYQLVFVGAAILNYTKRKLLVTFICLALSLSFVIKQVIRSSDFYNGEYVNYYKQMNAFIGKLVEKNPESVFVADDTYTVFLRYNYLLNNKPIPELQTESDKINKNYKFIILPVFISFPAKLDSGDYFFYYKNPFIRAYFYKKSSK